MSDHKKRFVFIVQSNAEDIFKPTGVKYEQEKKIEDTFQRIAK